ncbi:MAG: metallophosphoesterase [Pontiellaceae bacterium]|nr:metallophosphoesterase [Pontiellaceae bacterium]
MNTGESHKIGLLSDLHYDGSTEARARLRTAVEALNALAPEGLLVLGDLVNGTNAEHSVVLLNEVAELCGHFGGPIYYLHGNHDLDYLSKAEFYRALGREGAESRFTFTCGGYRFIVLDACFSPEERAYERGNFVWQRCYIPPEELEWLAEQLAESKLPVVVAVHQRIDYSCTHAVENDAAVRAVISAAGNVAAVVQGHNHVNDRREIGQTIYYTVAAHVDGAPPSMAQLDPSWIRLEPGSGSNT